MRDSWRDVVRDGYDAVSWSYRGDDDAPSNYRGWTATLLERLPNKGGAVVDLGCGCGVPLARELAAAGHHLTGVDVSPVQIARARRLVPEASLVEADLATVEFAPSSLDAVVCLYALIHLPDAEQRQTIEHVAAWLRPGGTFLATVGATPLTGTDPDWLGTGTLMWWHHPRLAVVRTWIHQAGLVVDTESFVPEGDHGHQLIIAVRPDSRRVSGRPNGADENNSLVRCPYEREASRGWRWS